MITVKSLSVAFGKKQVVDSVNFRLEKSQCLGIVGESGSGKSMTAAAIMQLLPFGANVAMQSQILFDNNDLLEFSEKKMRTVRGRRIGMIFQDAMSAFNPVLTIAQQMNEVLDKKITKKQRQQQAMDLLTEVGISDVKRCYESYPHQLSGGMRQRAMIAMALCGKPDLIIADEPTTALDVTIQAQVIDLLMQLRIKEKLTLIFITHDLAVVSDIADDVLVMQQGKVVEHGTSKQFFSAPQHEYSKKLLQAHPSIEPRQQELKLQANLLKVKDLKVYFGKGKNLVKAVDGIDFDLQHGETFALVGESGSGKSTVAKSLLRLIGHTSGHVVFEDKSLFGLSQRQLKKARDDFQIIFQDPFASLNPRRMIVDSIIEGMQAQRIIKGKKQQLQLVDDLLQRVGLLPEYKWRYPHEFSGGEKQRICIARALALKPKLLVLDEPTSALDVSIQLQILKLLESLQQETQMAYLLITHDLSVVAYLAHHIAVMRHGKIVEQGTTAEILKNPQQVYTRELLSAMPAIR